MGGLLIKSLQSTLIIWGKIQQGQSRFVTQLATSGPREYSASCGLGGSGTFGSLSPFFPSPLPWTLKNGSVCRWRGWMIMGQLARDHLVICRCPSLPERETAYEMIVLRRQMQPAWPFRIGFWTCCVSARLSRVEMLSTRSFPRTACLLCFWVPAQPPDLAAFARRPSPLRAHLRGKRLTLSLMLSEAGKINHKNKKSLGSTGMGIGWRFLDKKSLGWGNCTRSTGVGMAGGIGHGWGSFSCLSQWCLWGVDEPHHTCSPGVLWNRQSELVHKWDSEWAPLLVWWVLKKYSRSRRLLDMQCKEARHGRTLACDALLVTLFRYLEMGSDLVQRRFTSAHIVGFSNFATRL